MKKSLLAALLLISYNAYASWIPSEKYANWVSHFQVDKTWRFENGSHPEGASGGVHSGTGTVDFPGTIAWAFMSWDERNSDSDDHNMDWFELYLRNGNNDNDKQQIVGIYISGGDNDYWITRLTNYNGNVTSAQQERWYDYADGAWFVYMVTEYSPQTRELIERSGNNLQIVVRTRWDDNHWNTYTKSATVDYSNRQFLPVPNKPSVNDIAWTTHDGKTAVKYTRTIPSGTTFRLRSLYNTTNVFETTSANTNTTVTDYIYPFQQSKQPTAAEMYGTPLTYECYSDLKYTMNQAYYKNAFATAPKERTMSSEKTSFAAPAFAQVQDLNAKDNNDGSIGLTWTMTPSTNAQRDESPIVIERATDRNFTQNVKKYEEPYNNTQKNYQRDIPFDDRDKKDITFYFRLYRKNASYDDMALTASKSVTVNTNYARLENLTGEVNSSYHPVLHWDIKSGVCTPDMLLTINYAGADKNIPLADAIKTGKVEITDPLPVCQSISFTAQITEKNIIHGEEQRVALTIPSEIGGRIASYSVSKGFYNDRVSLQWQIDPEQYNFTHFQITRKELNTDAQAVILGTVDFKTGVLDYAFEDVNGVPGAYYLYHIVGYTSCDEVVEVIHQVSSVGFAQPYGVVSGQITYSGNQGVPDVAVSVIGEDVRRSRSLRFLAKNKATLAIPQPLWEQMTGNEGTLEFYMMAESPVTFLPVEIALEPGRFHHVALAYNEDSLWTYVDGDTLSVQPVTTRPFTDGVAFGGDGFEGFIDEIRVWNICRSQSEIRRTLHTYLNGQELGLTGYYRCDDAVEGELFDISQTGTTFNEHHLTMHGIIPDQDNIPTSEQLSLKAYTDKNGNYLINSVPYTVGGSLYNVIPTLGVHEFSPSSRPLYFSRDAATHNSIDFTDKSSFEVTGKVTFENTDYPVRGCRFYVDGQIYSQDGKVIETDAEGNYTIQVPIGEHAITVEKDGHTFVNAGRYPADLESTGRKALFDAPRSNLCFYDNTTVLVVGRVAGGEDENGKAHGFNIGKANLGQARIVLTPPEDTYNLNLSTTEGRLFACPDTILCYSTASTGIASGNLAHSVTVETDPVSGEFAVALPPIDFEIAEITLVHNPAIRFDLGTLENLTLGSGNIRQTTTDTLYTDSVNYKTVTYLQKIDAIHYALPELSITQEDNRHGAFGERTHYISLPSGQVDTIALYTVTDEAPEYLLGTPAYLQNKTYSWTIRAYETYVNYDDADHPVTTLQPMRNAIVTIENELGEKEVATEDGYAVDEKGDSVQVVAGQILSLAQNELLLDTAGTAQYLFTVGQPNIVEPYTYNVNITFSDAERTRYYSWSENGKCQGLIFGARTSGTNFITEGPDKLLFVLRDPPGGQSSATWQEGESIVTTTVTSNENNRGTDITSVHHFGATVSVVVGMGMATITETEAKNNITIGAKADGSTTWSDTKSFEITSTKSVSTTSDYPYVGTSGDVFVGASTNVFFGNAREVDLERVQDNPRQYRVVVRDAISTGSTIKTSFNYTTMDVEDKVIPNYVKVRNALLQTVDPASYNTDYPNMTNEPVYITTLSPDDPRFGSNNDDRDIWGSAATPVDSLGGPSYIMIPPHILPDTVSGCIDQVCHYNNQIRRWQNVLADNEECKVRVHHSDQKFDQDKWDEACDRAAEAMEWRRRLRDPNEEECRRISDDEVECSHEILEQKFRNTNIDTSLVKAADYYSGGWLLDNISLGGGASVSSSKAQTVGRGDGKTEVDGFKGLLKSETGMHINDFGFTLKTDSYLGYNHVHDKNTNKTKSSSISYTLDANTYEYMSVDVYAAPDGYGPIFSTRGGQTYCPYEGEERTKYFEPGEHEIHTATIQMEEPEIRAEQTTVTDVPIGGKAIYSVTLANIADISPDYGTWLKLYAAGDYNPLGAQVSIDGAPLTDAGRLIRCYPSVPVSKTLVITQADPGVLDYDSVAIILASDCASLSVADTLWLSAHFVPTCSDITLRIDNAIINTTTGDTLPITITGYDRNFRNFKNIRLQYRAVGDNDWHLISEFNPEGPNIYYSLTMDDTMFPDGEYEFRAVTACTFGKDEVPNESAIVTVIKDTQRPVALGLPSPINGIYTSNNQIYVTLNEPIQTGRVRDKNISVTGVLNAHNVSEHSVALQVGKESAYSDADFNCSDTDFTLEMWYNYSEDGMVFSHALGTDLGMNIAITNGYFTVYIGNFAARSQVQIPKNQWCFITLEYQANMTEDGWGTLTAHYALNEQEVLLFDHIRAPKYDVRGNIVLGGDGLCKMHDVAIWYIHRDWATSLSERNHRKDSYTDGLISYWPMDEGEGIVARDIIRSRNLQVPAMNSWWYNNNNIALAIPAGQVAKMNLSECPIMMGEDYVFEFWFRMTQDGTLFSLSDSSLTISCEVNTLQLMFRSSPTAQSSSPTAHYQLTTGRIVDGNWHHFALNYRHSTLPIFMIDGNALEVLGLSNMPYFTAENIVFSSEDSEAEVDIDEIRLWNAYIMPQSIALNRRNEVKGNESGLIAYYPMEKDTVDEAMQPIKVLSLDDRVSSHQLTLSPLTSSFLPLASPTSPALRKQRPTETVKHSYTPSARNIVINITENAARIEGCTLEIEVTDLVDEHGNYSTPIRWTTFVDRNQLRWDEEAVRIAKTALQDTTFTLTIVNNSGTAQNWYIANLPLWLTLDENNGILQPLQRQQLTATISGSLAIGNYERTIYLVGDESVMEPLRLTVRVNAERPDWNITPADYEYSMNVFATATIDSYMADDSEDILAAFIGNQLAGIASPQLLSAYNRHYIMMNIYANLTQNEKDSINAGLSLSKHVTFKYWDASTGRIYTHVGITLPGSTNKNNDQLLFAGGQLVGSIKQPIRLQAGNIAEQSINLEKGWNWISFNVLPEDVQLNAVLRDMMENITIIKSQSEFAQLTALRDSLRGSLKVLDCIHGYKMHVSNPYTKTVEGSVINPMLFGIPLQGGNAWNWIGYLPQMSLDVNTALAYINPSEGDIIKSRTDFAIWDGYRWVGSLKTMSPGNAYLYCNIGNSDLTLYYPSLTAGAASLIQPRSGGSIPHSIIQRSDSIPYSIYAGNMTLTAVVMQGDQIVTDAEVAIYAGDGCRAVAVEDEGLWFITIPGDLSVPLTIRVTVNGVEWTVDQPLTFVEDAVVGTIAAPYIIRLDDQTDLHSVPHDANSKFLIHSSKFIKDGRLYIRRGDKTYNAQGAHITH